MSRQPILPETNFYEATRGPRDAAHRLQPSETMIGVALGSPGKAPPPYRTSDAEALSPSRLAESSDCASSTPDNPGSTQQKGGRWKNFGSLFGRKHGVPMPDHRAHRTASVPDPRPLQPNPPTSVPHHPQKGPGRDWIGSEQLGFSQAGKNKPLNRKSSLRKPRLVKKHTENENMVKPGTLQANFSKHKREGSPRSPQEIVTVGKSTSGMGTQHGPLLQVDIPNIELDRFSVMFSGLLHANQQSTPGHQQSLEKQPSLLARRQGNLPGLSATPQLDFHRPWMQTEPTSKHRAASPGRSPSFSLFPPSPPASGRKTRQPVRERSPLKQAKPTPGFTSSGKAETSSKIPLSQQNQFIVLVHTPPEDYFSPSQPGNSSQDGKSLNAQRPHPSPSTPQPHPRPQDAASSNRRSSTPNEDPLRKAAEVSIARQISISQRQRQVLLQAAAQPKIVNVRPQASTARKSHHLVLEDAA
ncbi:MAG: hypothetical protein Q9220_000971 [cf. Caloplaca sp. 1 TL-2023]